MNFDIDNIPDPTPVHKIINNNSNSNMASPPPSYNKYIEQQSMQNNQETHNKQLIQSITSEIMKNLEHNKKIYKDDDDDEYTMHSHQSNNKKLKKKYDDEIDEKEPNEKDMILNMMSNKLNDTFDVETKYTKSMLETFFVDYFNYKEFLILLGVYFLLSQEMIKDTIGSYFTSINEDENGRVQMKGVIIYGIILSVLFIISRKFII